MNFKELYDNNCKAIETLLSAMWCGDPRNAQQKKYAEAEQQYTKAISLDANNISAYNNRANAREMLFDLDGAQADTDTYNQLIMR